MRSRSGRTENTAALQVGPSSDGGVDRVPERPAERFTFRGNSAEASRHGWLRLTPAYSLHLVRELARGRVDQGAPALDPFSGSGTTPVACGELGLRCDAVDLNPFLVWLARAKGTRYTRADVQRAENLAAQMSAAAESGAGAAWTPPLYRIDKWWSPAALHGLGRAFAVLRRAGRKRSPKVFDLCAIAFCRALIETANVSFGHQSMSFKRGAALRTERDVAAALHAAMRLIADTALVPLPAVPEKIALGDSRNLHLTLTRGTYRTVITSPPYPNRMSYIRELRPYMYWFGHLQSGSDAGELDWQIIGGTWGAATSRLSAWQPAGKAARLAGVERTARAIQESSVLLAQYVRKYFHDMDLHVASCKAVLARGAHVHYVIGNSKFYDELLPAEQLLAELFERHRFKAVHIEVLRKRSSKRELFEYLVSATRP